MKLKTPESGVLRACLDLLVAERIWHRRINTGAVMSGKRFLRFMKKGDADILAVISIQAIEDDIFRNFPTLPVWLRDIRRPIPFWIECKSAIGKQSPDQERFEDEVWAEGHFYLLVRDVDDLRKWLRERGVIK